MNALYINLISLDRELELLNDPEFRIRDMRMAQEYTSWEVYLEFITPDKTWYRVTTDSTDGYKPVLELYKVAWEFSPRNKPHLYGLFDKEETNDPRQMD